MPEYLPTTANIGLNLDSTASQIPQGMTTYALNAQVDNFNGEQVTYQNEQANELCVEFPEGYKVVGKHNIIEKGYVIFFLASEDGNSEIGKVIHDSCIYEKIINAPCLNFSIDHPIHKVIHMTGDCSTQIYWPDHNARRFLDLDNLPYVQTNSCPVEYSTEIDCNKILINPNFSIPEVEISDVDSDGDLEAGTYQFAFQYSNLDGAGYTSFYSITNPVPIFDPNRITLDFNYRVSKSIKLEISNIDNTGYYESFNLAVIKTVNNISSVELVGTYSITNTTATISYTGQGVQNRLSIADIFQKFPIYEKAEDITAVQDVLVWADLTADERISYQSIASQVNLKWQTHRLDGKIGYKDPVNSVYTKGYMRDEVYPLEIVFLLDNGKQTDGFHIPGRAAVSTDLEPVFGGDVINEDEGPCSTEEVAKKRWQVYNTGTRTGLEESFNSEDACYTGPYEYGELSYWESTELYPCNEIWGSLANTPIRYPKLPDSSITHIHDSQGYIYPIGFRIDINEILSLIQNSPLTANQKSKIQGFKIVRGNRVNNKSVVAKGLINNVGKYQREGQSYFFPNYPYNDLRSDPFISAESNDLTAEIGDSNAVICYEYRIVNTSSVDKTYQYTDCDGVLRTVVLITGTEAIVCSQDRPAVIAGSGISESTQMGTCGEVTVVTDPSIPAASTVNLSAFDTIDSFNRYTFHSPDTSFYQPNLGNILKLETAEFGESLGHFKEVKEHSKYKFISNEAFITGLVIGVAVGFASNTIGVSTNVFNGTAAFTAYQTFISIIDKVIPRKNFAYQFNSIGEYTNFQVVPNSGNKQRRLDIANYLAPGMMNVGDLLTINNYQRESSIYLRTTKILPSPSTILGVPEDNSRWVLGENGCKEETLSKNISSYYAAIKRNIENQYGQIYSYETIDTGFQFIGKTTTSGIQGVFGGDIFINKFAYKSKLPFFIDNRVSTGSKTYPDDSDIFYNELGNIGNPNYWFSTDSTKGKLKIIVNLGPLFGVKVHKFDCPNAKFFYDSGKIYLFAYGIPYFYCESEVNVDMRQAFNSKEGDFFPRVSSSIPDDWLQEVNTTIQQDNTYHYNKTYSKQNKENLFTHIPEDFDPDCEIRFPFKLIFSDPTAWLTYKAASEFDLPENYGALVSVEGIENKAVLARFENKSLLYNALLTAPTSAQDVYLGQSLFSQNVPPLDFAETETGYAGSQHKLFIKTRNGHISTDSKRGAVHMFLGTKVTEITDQFVSKFFGENLPFYISKRFPTYPTDNHFKGVGLHGVFDAEYNRFILTKLDYEPKISGITLIDDQFYYQNNPIELTDSTYFTDRSFTISYDFDNKAWISFHTYIPNYYVAHTKLWYSGMNSDPALWRHNTDYTSFNKFYGDQHPYSLELPYAFKVQDEILQSIKDYTKVYQFIDNQTFIEIDDGYFNNLLLYNNQQCSGILSLVKKPSNKLSTYNKYPIYNTDNKEVLYTKSDSFYQINTFWDMVKSITTPIFTKSTVNMSLFKDLNQANMDYSKRSFRKAPIRGKNLKIRFTLDNRTDIKLISQVTVAETMKSFK